MMMRTVTKSATGASNRIFGSNSIPTDTKNSTANASCNGRESAAA